ncbi:PA14 domain-containing protein [Roseivirga sp. BDSF3-8]|uniref:PA14 domain-containing protein n=1 Tax=Roseivirga sp. BDSF3-8 TaxID=3241598 RepID=UPI00353236F4
MKKLICVVALLFLGYGMAFAQTAGGQRAVPKGTTSLNYGFYEYLPADYDPNSGKKYPVMIFLHGLGERGNGTTELSKVTYNGPPNLAQKGWDFPFIIISPQLPGSQGGWWGGITDEVVNYVYAHYPVDRSRLYVTGLSLGGNGTYIYASSFPEKVAAAVPVAAWGPTHNACNMKDIPTWAFHGDKDWTINIDRGQAMVNAINNCGGNAKFTIYPGVGHNSWTRTYDKSAGHDVYSWLMQHSRGATTQPVNYPPTVNAGADKSMTLPSNSVTLYGNGNDNDGYVASYQWTKVSGPSATMSGAGSKNLSLSNLQAGTYTFQLTATDDDGAKASDKVNVNVADEPTYTPPSSGSGLAYKYYEGLWDFIPNTSGLTPKKTGEVANITMAMRNRDNAFLLTFDGAINIPTAGTYTFFVNSDDASNLYIDGKRVVDNDGLHSPQERSGQVYLSAGAHDFSLHYYEHYGSEILEARWKGPGISKQLIPDSAFGGSSSSDPEPSDPTPAPAPTGTGVDYKVYKGNWEWMPNFGALSPTKTGNTSNFNISVAGLDTNFGIDFTGSITVPAAGTYTFYTASDDGSKLYINGSQVVNNDGLHAEQEKNGSVYLAKGTHTIRVSYFEQYGGEVLKVKWAGPGISKQVIPNSVLGDGSGSSAPAPSDPDPGYTSSGKKLMLNFNHYQPASGEGWNSLSGDPRSTTNYSGFDWNDGASSNVSVTLADAWGGANEFGMVTGDDSGVLPDDVMKTSFWVSDNNAHIVTVKGLDPDKVYDFTFFGSRNGSGNRTTDYAISGTTVSLDASYNSSETVNISSVKPDQYGNVKVTVTKQSGASYGYLNAMIIEELSSTISSAYEIASDLESEGAYSKAFGAELTAYPNPFTEYVTVEVSQASGSVTATVTDLNGRQVMSRIFDGSTARLDLSGNTFAAGTYLLTVSDQAGYKETMRIIKE